jgi:hypothetical protein
MRSTIKSAQNPASRGCRCAVRRPRPGGRPGSSWATFGPPALIARTPRSVMPEGRIGREHHASDADGPLLSRLLRGLT